MTRLVSLFAVFLLFVVPSFGQGNTSGGAVVVRDIRDQSGDSVMDDANDAVKINCVTGCGGSGGTSMTDEGTFTEGTTDITPAGGIYNSTLDTITDGQAGAFQMTNYRGLHVNIRDDAGDSAMDGTNDAVRVNVVQGSGGGASHVDDAVFTLGTDDVAPVAGLLDDTAPTACTEGDVCVARMSSDRHLRVIGAATAAEGSALPGVFAVIAADDGTDTQPLQLSGTGDLKVTMDGETLSISTFPDNEPFDVAQYGGVAVGAGNAFHVQPGTGAVFSVDDNAGALTVDGTVAATQSGTWTVQPGNTANTTPWLVEYVPMNTCTGTTKQDITQVDVATGGGSALTSTDTCVTFIYVTNKTSNEVAFDLDDKQGTPVAYMNAYVIPPNSTIPLEFHGMKFVSGVQVIAGTASALNARLVGVQ